MGNTPRHTLNTVQQETFAWKKLLLFSPPAPVDKIFIPQTFYPMFTA
jgi:hypothetical protein